MVSSKKSANILIGAAALGTAYVFFSSHQRKCEEEEAKREDEEERQQREQSRIESLELLVKILEQRHSACCAVALYFPELFRQLSEKEDYRKSPKQLLQALSLRSMGACKESRL